MTLGAQVPRALAHAVEFVRLCSITKATDRCQERTGEATHLPSEQSGEKGVKILIPAER